MAEGRVEREVWVLNDDETGVEPRQCVPWTFKFDGCPTWKPVENPPERPQCYVEDISCWLTREEALAELGG